MSEQRKVSCGTHGSVLPAFVCGHLLQEGPDKLGFNEADLEEGDVEQQAWCDGCDAMLERDGEWNDENEKHADIRLVCEFCFAKLRAKHAGESA